MASTTKTVKVGEDSIVLDSSVANTIAKNGRIVRDISNDSYKYYSYKTHETMSLASAVVLISKKNITASRVTRIDRDGANYTLRNLKY